jgi:hypothetical protein
MGIKALSLELFLCWELTGQDAAIDRGFSPNGNNEERADKYLVGTFSKICLGGL